MADEESLDVDPSAFPAVEAVREVALAKQNGVELGQQAFGYERRNELGVALCLAPRIVHSSTLRFYLPPRAFDRLEPGVVRLLIFLLVAKKILPAR